MDLLSFNFKYYEDWSYFNLFAFGGRGGLDKPDLACLGLLYLSLSLSRFTPSEPLPNSSKIDWVYFIRSNMS